MVAQCRPLVEVLAEIPDPRERRGTRHPLPAILGLVCAAILCGYRSYSGIAEWARVYGPDLVGALGFTQPIPPCPATLCNMLRRLNREDLEAKLGAWAEAVAIDNKTNEILAVHVVLRGLVIAGCIFTIDALLTQREVAQAIVVGVGTI